MDHDRMVDIGVGLVSRFGAKALSLTSVARQAGVARATAYRMFGGREALVHAMIARELGLLRTRITEWSADEPDIAERVHQRVVKSLEYIREHEALQYILRNEPEEIVRALVTSEGSGETSLITAIVDATEPDVDPEERAAFYPDARTGIEFMVRTVYSCMLVPSTALSDDEIADLVVRAVIR
ncbi:MAG: TetR/AcrR family transcriptional regulator [Gordonia sp. (in: high G+C Gram-positive bacteria)]